MRGATYSSYLHCRYLGYFNPRSSCEERLELVGGAGGTNKYFNPRSSCEERPVFFVGWECCNMLFQSTLLMRGATRQVKLMPRYPRHFNPRSSCEERRRRFLVFVQLDISIHAPHARSDRELLLYERLCCISIHAPHARSDRS